MTLKEEFYKELGKARDVNSILRAYALVNGIAAAREAKGGVSGEEYVEMAKDYDENLVHVRGLRDAIVETWDSMPEVVKRGKEILADRAAGSYLERFRRLSSAQRRQVTQVLEYIRKKEGYRKQVHFLFADDTEVVADVVEDVPEEEKEQDYNRVKGLLTRLIVEGGVAGVFTYQGTPGDDQVILSGFAARPGAICILDPSVLSDSIIPGMEDMAEPELPKLDLPVMKDPAAD